MDTHDRRVKRTQSLLAKALIELTLEKGYDAVSIREITDRADIGYATFFRHYPDKEALLAEVLEVFLSELLELLDLHSGHERPERTGKRIFQYVQQHHELCQVLLSTHGSAPLLQRVQREGIRSTLQHNVPLEGSPVPAEIAANHIVAASIALIQWWLEHAMPYSPERMGEIYRDLIIVPTRALAFQP